MLASARAATDEAVDERPVEVQLSSSMLTAMRFMNRAGGFLEAVGIMNPELGAELLAEFESFVAKIEVIQADNADAERRAALARRARNDRRAWERRLDHDRRRHSVPVAAERRVSSERRADTDRRTGRVRELADRRLRSVRP